MAQAANVEVERIATTAGDIAAINLDSARQRSWNKFWAAPEQPQVAELIVEQEQLTAQFLGDLAAFDRLDVLVQEIARVAPESARTALIAAQVACATHRFAEAREYLARARERGAEREATDRLALTLDQATGNEPVRRSLQAGANAPHGPAIGGSGSRSAHCSPISANSTRPIARMSRRCVPIRMCRPSVPRGPAFSWACCGAKPCRHPMQRAPRSGIARRSSTCRATSRRACISRRSVSTRDALHDAMALLEPALDSGDPEVSWRLADIAQAAGDASEAALHLATARSGFEALLAQASARVRGSRRGVLRGQRRRSGARLRARQLELRQSSDAARIRAVACDCARRGRSGCGCAVATVTRTTSRRAKGGQQCVNVQVSTFERLRIAGLMAGAFVLGMLPAQPVAAQTTRQRWRDLSRPGVVAGRSGNVLPGAARRAGHRLRHLPESGSRQRAGAVPLGCEQRPLRPHHAGAQPADQSRRPADRPHQDRRGRRPLERRDGRHDLRGLPQRATQLPGQEDPHRRRLQPHVRLHVVHVCPRRRDAGDAGRRIEVRPSRRPARRLERRRQERAAQAIRDRCGASARLPHHDHGHARGRGARAASTPST